MRDDFPCDPGARGLVVGADLALVRGVSGVCQGVCQGCVRGFGLASKGSRGAPWSSERRKAPTRRRAPEAHSGLDPLSWGDWTSWAVCGLLRGSCGL